MPAPGSPRESPPLSGEQDLLGAARRGAETLARGIDRSTDTLRALASSADELMTRVAEVRQAHLGLQADLERAALDFSERERVASTLATRLSELAADLALQQNEWQKTQAETATAHAQTLEALEARAAQAGAERTELRAALDAERGEKARLVARVAELEVEFETERTLGRAAFDARLAARESELQTEYARSRGEIESNLEELKQRLAETLDGAARAEHERRFALEEQDRFVKSLMDEHEARLAELTRSRDEAVASAERMAREASAPRRVRGSGPTLELVSRENDVSFGQRVSDLEEQLEQIQHERELSREVLRRLQVQRDEAQETAARLTRQVETLRRAAQGDASSGSPHARISSGSPTLPELPRKAVAAASEPSTPADSPAVVPPASTARSALAAALAATDPSQRRRQIELPRPSGRDAQAAPRSDPEPTQKAPLKPKLDLAKRPLVDYSRRDVEPDRLGSKPPRRHGR
jgi:chromosome segregation ATPase